MYRPLFLFQLALWGLLLGSSGALVAQPNSEPVAESTGVFDLLARQEIADITVSLDLNTMLDNRRSSEYLPAEFTFDYTDDVELTIPVRMRVRGRYRRMKCQFPPLKLKFRKKDLAAHDLNEFNELKLVTHCLDDKMTSRNLIAREYLAYRLFDLVSPNSFRVQMVNVTYRNTSGNKPKKIKGWGIIIEDADELAARMQGEPMDTMGLSVAAIHDFQADLTSLFQFMIGNTDWEVRMNRNLQMVYTENAFYPIPYDFDFSGLVSAPYAVPRREVGQSKVRQRVYLGHAKKLEDLSAAIAHFQRLKPKMWEEVDRTPLLTSEAKDDVYEYLEEFFQLLEDKEKAAAVLFPPTDGSSPAND